MSRSSVASIYEATNMKYFRYIAVAMLFLLLCASTEAQTPTLTASANLKIAQVDPAFSGYTVQGGTVRLVFERSWYCDSDISLTFAPSDGAVRFRLSPRPIATANGSNTLKLSVGPGVDHFDVFINGGVNFQAGDEINVSGMVFDVRGIDPVSLRSQPIRLVWSAMGVTEEGETFVLTGANALTFTSQEIAVAKVPLF